MAIESDRNPLARRGAKSILAAYQDYQDRFREITRRAQSRFEERDWHGLQHDAIQRLDLYRLVIDYIVAAIRVILGASIQDIGLWSAMRAALSDLVRDRSDIELVETFFNSVTRRIFATVGVDPRIEFVSSDFDARPPSGEPVVKSYEPRGRSLPQTIRDILTECAFAAPFEDLERDAELAAKAIHREWRAVVLRRPIEAIELVRWVFYRNKGAYLVGRLRIGAEVLPLVLALHHERNGVFVDAVLMTEDEVNIVFSFTRSYFHVDVDRPRELVVFLKSLMPRKPVSEIYTSIGYNKHGKTELYRELLRHIDMSTDRFEIARGDRGMVMIVFTMPSFDVVFKVIRDRFDPPKTTTRREVMEKYELVYKHDRGGRLADAQVFEHLAFPRDRFAEGLLSELTAAARETVTVNEQSVHINHLYTERRMVPLNVYLRDVDDASARGAVLDYGQAIKDMAATNIFPGDMLLKNFGVTRHRRVVFYDYDELCPLTECHFRDLPPPGDTADEDGSEPSFYVDPHDVFPEEFLTFMGLKGALRDAFVRFHHDLLTPYYWRSLQARHRKGDVMDIIPYSSSRRLKMMEVVPYRPSRHRSHP